MRTVPFSVWELSSSSSASDISNSSSDSESRSIAPDLLPLFFLPSALFFAKTVAYQTGTPRLAAIYWRFTSFNCRTCNTLSKFRLDRAIPPDGCWVCRGRHLAVFQNVFSIRDPTEEFFECQTRTSKIEMCCRIWTRQLIQKSITRRRHLE
jgi:hypothetical protein